ncbi:amidase signature domain-containing protein [Aspergillus germanicus]
MVPFEPPFCITIKPMPEGSSEFEAKRAALLKTFQAKVPPEYRLPQHLIANPPSDVTSIPSTCGILSTEEIAITETYDAVGLAEAIASRKYTALAVTTAFLKRSIIAHQLTCCLTQWLTEEAMEQAKELDDYMAEHGKPIGPLHGVPISIKDHIPIAGTFSSQGSLASIVKDEKDCQMISILRSLGAVFYCKTNQPQALMHLESDSHWGRVLNPFNIQLSAGGSTGGEAALIGLRGSVLGVGTDIGGSIRGPAAFCGIYGFKATSYTLPMDGFLAAPFAAELNVLCSTGPMCTTLRDMDMFMRVMADARPYLLDPRLVPIPWTGLQTSLPVGRRLKVGIIKSDGFIEPQPPRRNRLVENPTLLLARRRHATQIVAHRRGRPIQPLTEAIWREAKPTGMLTAEAVNAFRRERDEFRLTFARSCEEQDVDVVIGPAFVGPACAHDTALYWTYTSLYNLVDYPCVVVPTPLRVEAGEEYDPGYTPLSEACADVKRLWESGNFEGAPLALQVVARKYHDSELFGALGVLKDILGLP